MRDIPFVDAHVHLWDLERISYPWLTPPFADDGPNGSVAPIAKTYLLDDYLADAEGWTIAGMVHVDAGAAASGALDETEWLQNMADERGLPSGIVAFASLDDPDVERLLAAHAEHRNVRGIRHIVNWHADPRRTYCARDVTADPIWQRGFDRLGKYGLSFDLQCYPGQFANVAQAIVRNPEVPVILNHCGMPVDGLDQWRAEIERLTALPNVAVKMSGFGFIERAWKPEAMLPFARELIDRFGPDRVLFASDFPTDKLFCDFAQILETFTEIASGFGDDERRAMFGRNADRIYRLGLGV
ncbi:amidohydrolase [Sphingosinicella sp. BN140058]|uniref:amidohydrolase family protein n=1 Tax=Sphingosinicella sp. BN140058 TaxID=1892855 RepID=UPI0010106453|nr:amidohydrolase family protein [Sphingosinicella sp. BN140058]QAY76304.1 amidohydrolase [Sphingosinicella sp. BN140058]